METAEAMDPARPAEVRSATGGAGRPALFTTAFDLATVGYVVEEWLVGGTAAAWAPAGELGPDGRWAVRPVGRAPFTTRVVVHRPCDPGRSNGTVVVEWLNVSSGREAAPDWTHLHNHLVREGVSWVGVTAQALGVNGGANILGDGGFGGLAAEDPERYGALRHPGDGFSYDVFSQVGRLVREPGGPLLPAVPRLVLAVGESQSAFRLTTYVNAVDPAAAVFDGFLVHSRQGSAAPLADPSRPGADGPRPPSAVRLRTDLRVPVLTVQTETDLGLLGFLPARQDDDDRSRLWEIAGSAHADTYTVRGFRDDGRLPPERVARLWRPTDTIAGIRCDRPINAGPQHHYVLQAAVAHLERWALGGPPPPTADRLAIASPEPLRFATDEHGNVRGGVRSPWVDVPLATYSGLGQAGDSFARLFGVTTPLDPDTLARRYPSVDDYLRPFVARTRELVDEGFLLAADAEEIVAAAPDTFALWVSAG